MKLYENDMTLNPNIIPTPSAKYSGDTVDDVKVSTNFKIFLFKYRYTHKFFCVNVQYYGVSSDNIDISHIKYNFCEKNYLETYQEVDNCNIFGLEFT